MNVVVWLAAMEMVGIYAFAISGSLLATKKGFDVVGSIVLASFAGLGGGVVRDILRADGVPLSLENPTYLVPVVLAALSVFVGLVREGRLHRTLVFFDALGLSLFCVMGAAVAHDSGMGPLACTLLGTATAVGGGVIRDVVANETPQIFSSQGLYALPALLGAVSTTGALVLGYFTVPVAVGTVGVVLAIRLLSAKYNWTSPGASLRKGNSSSE